MKKFQIPSKLNKIGKISDPEKSFQKLLDLARTMNINLDSVVRDENGFLEKAEVIKKIRSAYKEFISKFFAVVGFIMISLSGISAIIRSFSSFSH